MLLEELSFTVIDSPNAAARELTTFGRRILRSRFSLLALFGIDFEFVVFVVVVFFSSVVVSDEVCLTVLSLSFSVGSDVASCCVSLLSSVVDVVLVIVYFMVWQKFIKTNSQYH